MLLACQPAKPRPITDEANEAGARRGEPPPVLTKEAAARAYTVAATLNFTVISTRKIVFIGLSPGRDASPSVVLVCRPVIAVAGAAIACRGYRRPIGCIQ
jgi:hypothetical protein